MELEELEDYFRACDTNGDGTIQFGEFQALLANLGSEMDREECRIGFREVDTDGDGVIDFNEFLAWWTEH
ncbi:MAG: EF-hand domain-containing protein [Gammaproteobacteria bacterium]|jgi:Ca2+-binding EF-hand superfamily protein